jgi:serine/threonine protein kinase
MLIGMPPFFNEEKTKLYKSILKDTPSFCLIDDNNRSQKMKISSEAKDLILKLLEKSPADRIKPHMIESHPWFNDMNFNDLIQKKVKAPFVPKTVNFFILIPRKA